MPELPEVETIRLSLLPLLQQKELRSLETFTPEVLQNTAELDLSGTVLRDIRRRSKYLIFALDRAYLLVHLRMTGKLLYHPTAPVADPPHLRARLHFTDGALLDFTDIRRFGRLQILTAAQLAEHQGLALLGPEPLEASFAYQDFRQGLAKHPRTTLKALLLSQKIVAGLGNIYCDELLFRCRLHPARQPNSLSESECQALFAAIKPLLLEAIGLGGTSFRDYVDGLGGKGKFQLQLQVYQRKGKACPCCGTTIERCVLAGRATHFCPSCQSLGKES